jgi:hypothetical protein
MILEKEKSCTSALMHARAHTHTHTHTHTQRHGHTHTKMREKYPTFLSSLTPFIGGRWGEVFPKTSTDFSGL